jgi:drug/metabolite transporter (DMT)-like permease
MAQSYILLAIVLWSSLGIVIRLAAVPVHILTFYALVVSGVCQASYIAAKGYHREIAHLKQIRYPLLLGGISVMNMLTFYFAYQTTTIANAVLTHYTAPVLVAFLAVFFLKEKMTWPLIMAILLASAGLWIMLNGLSLQKGQALGIIAGVVSGGAYALVVILGRLYAPRFRPVVLTFLVNMTGIIFLAPFVREFPRHAVSSFLFMGIVHSTIAPVLYYRGLRDVSASRTAVLGYLEPLCAILLGMLILNEMPGMRSLYGGILIVCSGFITITAANREAA